MMFTMKDSDVARLCDRMPMTLDPVLQLARRCGVPPVAAAVRLMGVAVRFCAAVLSQADVLPNIPRYAARRGQRRARQRT